jgi:hypothetical protein
MSSNDDKYTMRDKEPGFFDSLFGTGHHEREIRDSDDDVVGTVRDKQPGFYESLFGTDRHEKEIRNSDDEVVGTVRDKQPGFYDSLFGTDRHEKEIRNSDDEVVGSARDKQRGFYDSLFGTDRHAKDILNSEGKVVGSMRDKEPGLLDSILGINRRETELRVRGISSQKAKGRPVTYGTQQSTSDDRRQAHEARHLPSGMFALLAVCLIVGLIWIGTQRTTQSSVVPKGEANPSDWRAGGDPSRVPSPIRRALDNEYPGWHFPQVFAGDLQVCRQPNAAFLPGLVWGDFDGDGTRDYALAVQRGDKRYTLAFLGRGSTFKKFVLNPSGWNILGVASKGQTLPQVGEDTQGNLVRRKPVTLDNDALIGIHCESSSVAFVYNNGVFEHFFMSD